MQHTKSAAHIAGINCLMVVLSSYQFIAYVNNPSAPASRGRNSQRGYSLSLSKHRMKLSRYRLSGTTHSRGIGATFCVRYVVTANNKTDAHAASPIHRILSANDGEDVFSSAVAWPSASLAPLLFQAVRAQAIAKTTNPQDHATAWLCSVRRGSTKVG